MQAKPVERPTGPLAVDVHSASRQDPFYAARNLSTPVWVFDIDHGRIVYANPPACIMWQADTEAELSARDMSKGMSTTVAKRLKQYQADFEQNDVTFHEMWTLYPNGEPLSTSVAFRGFRLPDGRMAMQCEIIERKDDAPENLRSAEALLHTDVMIALFKLEGRALYMNPAARNTFDMTTCALHKLFADQTDFHVMMFDLDGAGEHRAVSQVTTEQGKRWFDMSAKLCNDAATGEPAVLLTAIDVSELKTARDKARYLADRDQLTGCYNRAFLQRHIDGLTQSSDMRYRLVYFDVDKFKQVNDTHGHKAGDDVLKELSHRAQKVVDDEDIVVRLGGDEFVILLRHSDNEQAEMEKLDRVFGQLSGSIKSGGSHILTSVSVGATIFNPAESDFTTALREADIALYHSKREGRNRYTLYSEEMGRAAREKTEREAEIRHGLKCNQFDLHFQPRLDLRSGKVVSMEGLARWDHPERGIVEPKDFIPICEETGLIDILGQQVLEIGFSQVLDWQQQHKDVHLSLNISPRQFADDRLMEFLRKFAEVPDFPTDRIELEITENVLIGELDVIAEKLRTISDWGYKIAIDDFGTGYSNLAYISRFPLSCLKIDQSFIQQLPGSGPIVSLIIALGRQLGATIVAEGVETAEQYDWLMQNECDQVQGYLISKPGPLKDVLNEEPILLPSAG